MGHGLVESHELLYCLDPDLMQITEHDLGHHLFKEGPEVELEPEVPDVEALASLDLCPRDDAAVRPAHHVILGQSQEFGDDGLRFPSLDTAEEAVRHLATKELHEVEASWSVDGDASVLHRRVVPLVEIGI